MRAEILSIGTELLLGDILNTNAQFLAKELAGAGVEVYHQEVVGDNAARLKEQMEQSLSRCDLIITTGGLGPTYDDLTKETTASLFHKKLIRDEALERELEEHFVRLGRVMTDNNRKQALIPEGGIALDNPNGTAPGIWVENEGKIVVLLPGPPREMEPMFRDQVLPRLRKATGKCICSSTVHLFGIGESAVEDRLREMMTTLTNPTVAPYAKTGEVQLRITAMAPTVEEAHLLIDPVRKEICEIFGEKVYGIDVGSLQNAVVRKLREKGLHAATAESCTGGLVSQRITQVPGSSEVFECGICTYSNRIKEQLVSVQGETLAAHGAVSAETALEMARGIRKVSGAEIGVSTTGVAGPGTSEGKEVGTVFVGVSSDRYEDVISLHLRARKANSRDDIRYNTSNHALFAILTALSKY